MRLTTLLPGLLSACAIAAPPLVPSEDKKSTLIDIFRQAKAEEAKVAPTVYESDKDEEEAKPVSNATEAVKPTWSCNYSVSYKMLTYIIFGDNWNVSKADLKQSCEKGRSRIMDHWSYRDWTDEKGTHFCAKFNLPPDSTEDLEDRLDKVIAKDGWNPEINCELSKGDGHIHAAGHC